MDYNKPLDLPHAAEKTKWVDWVNLARAEKTICKWITSFHPKKLPCQIASGFLNGSYNLGQKFAFDDGTIWFLRLPRAGNILPEYADEKVAMEVEALHLVREKTSIPVPEIYAWGFAGENEHELGPFVLMSFIDGVCLRDVLGSDDGSRLLRGSVPGSDVEYIYRQMADCMLQLFKIDFDQIGNLPTSITRFNVPCRPLT